MNRLSLHIPVLLTLLLCLVSFNKVCAKPITLEKIAEELGTLEAVVIKAPNGRYLLNLGSDDDIKKGALWRVYTKEEKVIDPVTGKTLGLLPLSSAVCKVIKVEKQFSEISVHCSEGSCAIQSGDIAKRYHSIKALFQDVNGASFHLYERIRARLPLLDWQGYQRMEHSSNTVPPAYEVMLVADTGRLTIWSGGEILAASDDMTSFNGPSKSELDADPPFVPKTNTIKNGLQQEMDGAPLAVRLPGLNSSLKMENYQAVVNIDNMVSHLGIIDPDETKSAYFIYLANDILYARSLQRKQIYQYAFKGFGDVVNMSIGPNGLIAINIYVDSGRMASRILKFTGNKFTLIEKDIDFILQFNDIDGNGINESLFGQNFDPDDFLGSRVFHMDIDDSGRIKQQDSIDTPRGINLTGAVMADFDGNHIQESVFYNPGGRLVLYETGQKKWESVSSFAPEKVMLIQDTINESDAPGELSVWPHPAVFSAKDIILAVVPANQTNLWTMAGEISGNGGVGIFYANRGSYLFRLFNTGFKGQVQSVVIHDNKFYLAIVEGNALTQKGKTHILSVSMDELMVSLNAVM